MPRCVFGQEDQSDKPRPSSRAASVRERTRENLARTIDTLTERVSPANLAKRAMAQVRDQVSRPEVQAAAAAVAVVTVALLVWRRRRG